MMTGAFSQNISKLFSELSLVSGDVLGNFKLLFSRVQNILKKTGPFEMLLCVGSFFNNTPECQQQWKEYVEGREKVPIATFILGPCSTEHAQFFEGLSADGGELCTNVTCLGQRGVYTTSSGMQIAYVSGSYDRREFGKKNTSGGLHPYFTEQDIASMESYSEADGFRGVDLLLTSEWPKGVENYTSPPESLDMKYVGAEPVSRLAMAVKPRYHFAGKHHRFYERTPYRNHQVLQEGQQHVTRFISLAQVGNPDKKNRYLYAFSMSPMVSMDTKELTQQPPAVTNCPFTEVIKEKPTEDLPAQNFFFDPKHIAAGKKRKQRQQQQQLSGEESGLLPAPKRPAGMSLSSQSQSPHAPPPKPPAPKGPCWFCLGSPEVEKHLVVTIGEHSYLALPKGGLVAEHVLVLPIGHYAASTDSPPEVLEEMAKFRAALRKYYNSKNQSCVIFERNFRSQHLQLQVIPIPKTPSDALKQAFIDHGKSQGVELSDIPRDVSLSKVVQPNAPYFTVEFDEGPSLFVRIRGRFPLQFGREVLASPLVLNVPHRVDWKACSASKEEEMAAAKSMRQNFQPFDFN